jgi:hypothetical protein
MIIRLNTLTLRNFKGCVERTIEFDGCSGTVYGDNATGKTTLYDGLTWLLFGKDSSGSAPGTNNFQIKPLTPASEVADHAAETSVEAAFQVDDHSLTLRRTYFEVWTTKRGRAEKELSGHSSAFYVDGVPVKKNEFDAQVNALVDEQTFRTLTDVMWFCAGESEANRRQVLFDLIGGVSEEEILDSSPDFQPLAEFLGGKTVEQGKKILTATRKSLNTKKNNLPARLDEVGRTIKEYSQYDFDGLRKKREMAVQERDTHRTDLNTLRSTSGTEALRDRLAAKTQLLDALEAQNHAHRNSQLDQDALPKARAELQEVKRNLAETQGEVKWIEAEAARLNQAVEQCRADWREAQGRTFTPSACPTCGQALPPDQVNAAREKFEQKRADDKKTSVDMANRHKTRMQQLEEKAAAYREKVSELTQHEETLTARLVRLEGYQVTDLPDYATKKEALNLDIAALNKQISQVGKDITEAIATARTDCVGAERRIYELDCLLGCETALNNALTRQKELRDEARLSAEEMERVDALLDLCDQFSTAKAELIDSRVNGLFKLVHWKLFDQQINGGIRDCCQPIIDGVPYGSANNGAKINAGLDVIDTLSRFKGIRVPLFVDNAESVTTLTAIDTQLIRLVVSEGDKALRIVLDS